MEVYVSTIWDSCSTEDCHALEVAEQDHTSPDVSNRRHKAAAVHTHHSLSLHSTTYPLNKPVTLPYCCLETICFVLSRTPWRKLLV
jgi:hypothetical protein